MSFISIKIDVFSHIETGNFLFKSFLVMVVIIHDCRLLFMPKIDIIIIVIIVIADD